MEQNGCIISDHDHLVWPFVVHCASHKHRVRHNIEKIRLAMKEDPETEEGREEFERIFLGKEAGTDRALQYSHLCMPAACNNMQCTTNGHDVVETSAINQERKVCHRKMAVCTHVPTCFGCTPPPARAMAPPAAPILAPVLAPEEAGPATEDDVGEEDKGEDVREEVPLHHKSLYSRADLFRLCYAVSSTSASTRQRG